MRGWMFVLAEAVAYGGGQVIPVDGSAGEVFRAQANLIHYIQGSVRYKDADLPDRLGIVEWKTGEEVRTGAGLAEIMLSPGMVLRMGENSELKLVESAREKTEAELISGSVVIEILAAKPGIAGIRTAGSVITLDKPGLYGIGTEPAVIRVFDGSAQVSRGSLRKNVAAGTFLALDGTPMPGRLEPGRTDPLVRWSLRRAQILAAANVASARSIHDNQIPFRQSSWWWNANYGVLTYVPARGQSCGWAGFCYASPALVGRRGNSQPVAGIGYTAGAPRDLEAGDPK